MPRDLRYIRHMRTRAQRARVNADVTRASAEMSSDPQVRELLLVLATDYERIAKRAEQLAEGASNQRASGASAIAQLAGREGLGVTASVSFCRTSRQLAGAEVKRGGEGVPTVPAFGAAGFTTVC